MNQLLQDNEKKHLSKSLIILLLAFLYPLFALRRIKFAWPFDMGASTISNEVWIFMLLYLVKLLYSKGSKIFINKHEILMLTVKILLIIIITFGAFRAVNIKEYLYSVFLVLVPMLYLNSISAKDIDRYKFLIKFFVFIGLIYAILAIIASTNFGFLMELLGNPTNQKYYMQYRASLMLGSTITVSYFLSLTLPFCLYLNFTTDEKKWRLISIFATIASLITIALLSSRLAFAISVFIFNYFIFFVKTKKMKSYKKIIIIFFLIIISLIAYQYFNFSRLFIGFQDYSTYSRLQSLELGFYIFKNNPILGSGMGRYFNRIYSERIISVDGIVGLVDPHNLYILVLSELGIIGFVLLSLILLSTVLKFRHISETPLRKTAYAVMFSFLFGSLGGSHLFNEIGFSLIFWIYLSFFKAISQRDYRKKYLS